MTDFMIEFRDVSKRYGSLLANDHLSLAIRRGELLYRLVPADSTARLALSSSLKVGLTVSASIPIAVLSISLLKKFGGSTILENNIVQTTGSAGESIAAGVAFTCDPQTGRRDVVRVSAVAGLGDALVAAITARPVTYVVVHTNHAQELTEGARALGLDHRSRQRGQIRRRRAELHLAALDPVSPHLDLAVDPPQVLQAPVRGEAAEVAGNEPAVDLGAELFLGERVVRCVFL